MSGGDAIVQLQSEVRFLSREERQQLLQKADLPIVIPTDHAHTFNMYNIETCPQLLELRPELKKRKIETN